MKETNKKLNSYKSLFVAVAALIAMGLSGAYSIDAFAGKPADAGGGKGGGKGGSDGSDGSDGGSADCSSSADFPAMAYYKEATQNGKGKRVDVVGTDIYLANGDNSCAIAVHRSSATSIPAFSFKMNGSDGHIAYYNPSEAAVKYIKFSVSSNNVNEALPLAASDLVVQSSPAAAFGLYFNSDASSLYYSDVAGTSSGDSISLRSVDLSACQLNCSSQLEIAYQTGVDGGFSVSLNDAEDRLLVKYQNDSYNAVHLHARTSSGWSAPRVVLDNNDSAFAGSSIQHISLLGDRLAISYYDNAFKNSVLNIANCAVAGSQTCLSSGEAVLENHNISGGDFANFSSADSLLGTAFGEIIKVDLNSNSASSLGSGVAAESSM